MKALSSVEPVDLDRYLALQEKFYEMGGYDILSSIPNYLIELGLSDISLDKSVQELSGGQKTRLKLGKLLLSKDSLLLLDEPTNYLDVASVEWLENFLQNYQGIVMLISHDREFLNNCCNKILDLENKKYPIYLGNYDEYLFQKSTKEYNDLMIYKARMKEIDRLSKEAGKKKSEARVTDKKFIRGWEGPVVRKVSGKKAKTAQIILNKIENNIKKNMPDKPILKDKIKIDIHNIQSGWKILDIEKLTFSYDDKKILNNFNLSVRKGDRIALVGNNGSGKSTLLKIIIGEIQNYTGSISVGDSIVPAYFSQEHDLLDPNKTVIQEFLKYIEMNEGDARTYLYNVLFAGDQVFQDISTLSYGERARLQMAIILAGKSNFLLLDEPTSHMDIPSREIIEKALASYDGTMIVVSHDRYFLNKIGINRIVDLGRLEVINE
ncbi:MAG: ABC-F family ATP-binding cassette domain-containing protein [bacterium]